MELFWSTFTELGKLMWPYANDIALALVASLLVILGGDINRLIKKQTAGSHFLLRTLVFILVCTFGYGALTVVLTKLVKVQLASLSAASFALVVIGGFFALGVYAQSKKQI